MGVRGWAESNSERSVSEFGLRGASNVTSASSAGSLDSEPEDPKRARGMKNKVAKWRDDNLLVYDEDFAFAFTTFAGSQLFDNKYSSSSVL